MSWDDYELFLHVVRAGSIRAAARRLNIDHAAISRRLARLEEELGTKLLHRRSRGQLPTSAGQDLIVAAEAMEAQAQQIQRKVARWDAELEGWVRVSCFAVSTYASTPTPTHWLGWDPDGPYDGFVKQTDCVDLPVRHRFTDDLMLAEAAKHGLGAAALSCMLGDAEPGLVRLGPAHTVASVFVLRHPDHRSTARIRAFVSFIADSFREIADLIEGRRPQRRTGAGGP